MGGENMKYMRIAAVLILLVGVLSMSGCKPKVWGIDFTVVTDIDDWYQYGLSNISSMGLWLDNGSEAVAPVAFLGNFTAYLTFELNTKSDGEGDFELWFTNDWSADYWSSVCLEYLSTSNMIEYGAYESNGVDDADLFWDDGMLPSLLREGENVLKVAKSNKHFTVYINDVFVFSYDQGAIYEGEYYCPGLYSEYWDNTNDWIVYKDLTVEYTGSMINI